MNCTANEPTSAACSCSHLILSVAARGAVPVKAARDRLEQPAQRAPRQPAKLSIGDPSVQKYVERGAAQALNRQY